MRTGGGGARHGPHRVRADIDVAQVPLFGEGPRVVRHIGWMLTGERGRRVRCPCPMPFSVIATSSSPAPGLPAPLAPALRRTRIRHGGHRVPLVRGRPLARATARCPGRVAPPAPPRGHPWSGPGVDRLVGHLSGAHLALLAAFATDTDGSPAAPGVRAVVAGPRPICSVSTTTRCPVGCWAETFVKRCRRTVALPDRCTAAFPFRTGRRARNRPVGRANSEGLAWAARDGGDGVHQPDSGRRHEHAASGGGSGDRAAGAPSTPGSRPTGPGR